MSNPVFTGQVLTQAPPAKRIIDSYNPAPIRIIDTYNPATISTYHPPLTVKVTRALDSLKKSLTGATGTAIDSTQKAVGTATGAVKDTAGKVADVVNGNDLAAVGKNLLRFGIIILIFGVGIMGLLRSVPGTQGVADVGKNVVKYVSKRRKK
jgi:hypothetical protein